ncbi:unnamed protein product [Prorocentrum cordatum]|uniref:Uncharacterized protein n=1 Tax=Prorocentrum cordatum TaxID=2364126 RepID=A0ABN9Y4N2_9DINO|nr:unnamed protein product [Polarella glacialis]
MGSPIGARQKPTDLPITFDRVSNFNTETTTYRGDDKVGKGPKGFTYSSDTFGQRDTLATSLWNLTPDAQSAFGAAGNLLWISAPYPARKACLTPPSDRITYLYHEQAASLALRYELQFSDIQTPGRHSCSLRLLSKAPQPTAWAVPVYTPLENIPDTFSGLILFNFEAAVVQVGQLEQKTETRRLISVASASGNRFDIMVWRKYATTARTNQVLHVHRAEVSCTARKAIFGNAPAPRAPRQINVWSSSSIDVIGNADDDDDLDCPACPE